MMPCIRVWGILGGVRAPAPLEALVQRSSPAISLWLSIRHCGIDPEGCGERIERFPQVWKSAVTRVRG